MESAYQHIILILQGQKMDETGTSKTTDNTKKSTGNN